MNFDLVRPDRCLKDNAHINCQVQNGTLANNLKKGQKTQFRDGSIFSTGQLSMGQLQTKSKKRCLNLPHLLLDTLTEPTAQQGGGIFPPQQDRFSDIVDALYVVCVPFWDVLGVLLSINPL